MNNMNPVAGFYQHGLPGMTLRRQPTAGPIMPRCKCGRPISENKTYCLACLNAAIERIAGGEGNQAEMRAVMAQSTPEQRVAIVDELRRQMALRMARLAAAEIEDAGLVQSEPAD